MSTRRQKLAELRQKKALVTQLNKANAVKLLQQKKLLNLKKQNAAAGIRTQVSISGSSLDNPLGKPGLAALKTQAALTKLSPNDKIQLLSWLDLERNSEILSKTDKKIKEKTAAKLTADKLVQKAARCDSQILFTSYFPLWLQLLLRKSLNPILFTKKNNCF